MSARATAFLTPEDDRVTPADAVVYLMKHVHAGDLGFLEAFHDEEVSQATPVNAIAVLSRADEVAAGRLDAMESATRIAERYRTDPKVRRAGPDGGPGGRIAGRDRVDAASGRVPGAAGSGRGPRRRTPPPADLGRPLRATPTRPRGSPSVEREPLLRRFGLFGVRLAIGLHRRRHRRPPRQPWPTGSSPTADCPNCGPRCCRSSPTAATCSRPGPACWPWRPPSGPCPPRWPTS